MFKNRIKKEIWWSCDSTRRKRESGGPQQRRSHIWWLCEKFSNIEWSARDNAKPCY